MNMSFNEIVYGPAKAVADELHHEETFPDPQILRAALTNALWRIDQLESRVREILPELN